MPDANGEFRGSGWSRAREDGWERAFPGLSWAERDRVHREVFTTERLEGLLLEDPLAGLVDE